MVGAALLYDESMASFEWLFGAFLRCMNNKAPQTIFTDQCTSFPGAIKAALPSTYHALCTWHLLQTASRNLGPLLAEVDIETLMFAVYSEDEFNTAWALMKERCFPGDRPLPNWLEKAYGIREQWSSAWVRQHFTAGMKSSQLSESTNAVLRSYLQPDNNILQFLGHFGRVVASRRAAEMEQDFHALDKQPDLCCPFSPVLQCAAKHYTPTVFALFQEEYIHIAHYMVECVPDGPSGLKVFRCYMRDRSSGQPTDVRIVCVQAENTTLACSCRQFESFGMLCRHILTVMDYMRAGGDERMMSLPPHYIMKRWTKNARLGYENPVTAVSSSSQPNVYGPSARYQNLCAMGVALANCVCMYENAYRFAEEKLGEIFKEVQVVLQSESCATGDASQNEISSASKYISCSFSVGVFCQHRHP